MNIPISFLKEGAFIAQSIATYPTARAIRKLGSLRPEQLLAVEAVVFKWLGEKDAASH